MTPQNSSSIDNQVSTLTILLSNHNQKLNEVLKDNHLTPAGKEARKAKLIEETEAAIAKVEEDINFDQLADQIKRDMKPADLKVGDPIMDYLQQKEYRDNLKSLDPLEVQALYQSATESGDDPLLEAAVENAPPQFALVQPEIIEQGRLARSNRVNPELVEKMEDAEQLQHVRDYNLQVARNYIQKDNAPNDKPSKPHLVGEGDLVLSGAEGGR